MVGCSTLLTALQFEATRHAKGFKTDKGSDDIDLSGINATIDAVTGIIEQVNTTIGEIATLVDPAIAQWQETLPSLQEAITTVNAAAMMKGDDFTIGDTLKSLLPELNESILDVAATIPSVTAKIQASLAEAVSSFTALADDAYTQLVEANGQIAGAMPSTSLVAGEPGASTFAAVAKVNATIEELTAAFAEISNTTVSDAFGTLSDTVDSGLATFNETVQKALGKATETIEGAGGEQATAAQTALGGITTSLKEIISTVQSGVKDAKSAGKEAISALVETANSSLSDISAIGATLQGQVETAVKAGEAAQAEADALQVP